MTTPSRVDSGSATIWMIVGMAIVMLAGGISAAVGVVAAERHRAGAAADAAAITAALESLDGPQAACHEAAAVAAMDGAVLAACQLTGPISEVAVRVRLPGPLGRFGTATANARAGPVGAA